MISRYSMPHVASIWSKENIFHTWLQVELQVIKALETENLVPKRTFYKLASNKISIDINAIDKLEEETRHDFIAFLMHIESQCGPEGRYLHYGLTSSDVIDTTNSILLAQTVSYLIEKQLEFIAVLEKRAMKYAETPCIGRSHGIHGEPTTFGVVLAGHLAEAKRNLFRLTNLKKELSYGQISGAMGTYSHISPTVEAAVLKSFDLEPETVSTQVIPRDRHATYFMVLAQCGAALERLATNIRLLQQSEIGEVNEHFSSKQRGSSAMPHKKNPVSSENICGLARMLRGYVVGGIENITLWHERDISHSSFERISFPDAAHILAYMTNRATKLISDLVVNEKAMLDNLNKFKKLIFSESILLALIRQGADRSTAYKHVQSCAMESMNGKDTFEELLLDNKYIRSHLKKSEISSALDLKKSLVHCKYILDRAIAETSNEKIV